MLKNFAVLALYIAGSLTAVYAQSAPAPQWREGEVIVKFRNNVPHHSLLEGKARLASPPTEVGRFPSLLHFDTTAVASVPEAVSMLSALDEVEYALPNYIYYLEPSPLFSGEREDAPASASTSLSSKGRGSVSSRVGEPEGFWWLETIHMPELWEQPLITDHRPVIAIVDTGVDTTHPDLQGNIAPGGYDFVRDTTLITDPHGHGTHCAGIAAANRGGKVTGANPDALILPVTVMDEHGSGTLYNIVKGIQYAAEAGADIISLSIGGSSAIVYQDVIATASQTAIIVSSAGNDGYCMEEGHRDLHGMATLHSPTFPAALPGVIGVMATMPDGTLASWSNFDCDGPLRSTRPDGYNYELCVPGYQILSTIPDGGYDYMSGTSMACPMAAGAISRLMQCRSFSSREEMVRTLIATSNGSIDMMAAYTATDELLHPDTIRQTIDGVEYTFVSNGDGTLQVGDGHTPALDISQCPQAIVLPNFIHGFAVTTIAPHAFEGCRQLTSLRLGYCVDSIGAKAFSGCTKLTDLILTTTVAPHADATTFDPAHIRTVNLHITRGYTVGFVAAPVWRQFTHWLELPLRTGNRFLATVREPDVDMMVLIYDLDHHYGQVGAGQVAVSQQTEGRLVIPDKIKGLDMVVIGTYAFMLCQRLTEIVMPQNLVYIDGAAFLYCESLQRAELPSYVSILSSYAYSGCKNMKTLRLSRHLETIGTYAFAGCEALETITAPMDIPPYLPDNAFTNTDPLVADTTAPQALNLIYDNARLLVPKGRAGLYAEAEGWKLFRHIEELTEDGRDPAGISDVTLSRQGERERGLPVYNLQGQLVAGTSAALRDLKPGIYIVAGKKTILK